MKYCQIFKDKLGCNNADDVFNCLINNLKETIKTWDYFVNWDKVIKNYRDVEISLNLLNALIGKDDIETAARELLKEYPKVIGVIPALLAYRERKVKLLSNVSKFSITEYDFAKTIDVPSVSIGIYPAVLHALNNMDRDLLLVAKDDRMGREMQDLQLVTRKRASRKGD